MNNFDQFKSCLISLGMTYRNKYAEWPEHVILGRVERDLVERHALSLMKPSEIASAKENKAVLGFKIIASIEETYFAVCHRVLSEQEYQEIKFIEQTGTDLFAGENLKSFLGIPLEPVITTKETLYSIVLHNTERNPTIDAYSELNQAYDFFNQKLFNNELPKCLITFQREKHTAGYLAPNRFANKGGENMDELAMNPAYFGIRPITDTLSTLVHEQCHKWQIMFGKPSRNGYHNHEFSEKMESIGLRTTHDGTKDGKRVGQKMDHYIIEGGLFDIVCRELLSTKFTLSWFNRYAPVTLSDIDIRSRLKPIIEGLAELESPLKVDTAHIEFKPEPSENPDEPKPRNRSNRAKYQCPTCKTNMWGAPEKLILCGEEKCEKVAFIQIE